MYLYGASGHAKVIYDIINEIQMSIDGIFDDNESVSKIKQLNVSHNWNGEEPIIISIGSNKVRKIIADRLKCKFEKAIHPSAILSPSVSVDAGTVIMAGVVINSEAKIGKHCIINTGASIDHECIIEDYVHISPHATLCGNVHIGEGSWIGAGSTVIPGIKIGKWSIVGAGSSVIRDVPDNVIVAGVPAKVIKNKL